MKRSFLFALIAGGLLATLALAIWGSNGEGRPTQASPGFSVGVDLDASGNSATSLGGIETSRTVACGEAFDVDIYVTEVSDLLLWNVTFQYDPSILGIYARDVQMFPAASPGSDVKDRSDGDPGFTGNYDLLASDVAEPAAPESGNGVLARLSVRALAPGVTKAEVAPLLFFGTSGFISNPPAVNAQITVTGECATPVPTPTPEPSPSPTPPSTSTPTPTPNSGTSTPTPTPGTPTPTPPPGTVTLVAGWNDSCYQGATRPIGEALAGMANDIVAVYRMKPDMSFDRWFPPRPEVSTITDLNPYDQLLILMSGEAAWVVEPAGSLPDSVSLVNGWNSVCYLGMSKDVDSATAGISGSLAVLYSLAPDQVWRRFIPGRPEVSNLTRLETFTSVLILVTADGGALWTFDP